MRVEAVLEVGNPNGLVDEGQAVVGLPVHQELGLQAQLLWGEPGMLVVLDGGAGEQVEGNASTETWKTMDKLS